MPPPLRHAWSPDFPPGLKCYLNISPFTLLWLKAFVRRLVLFFIAENISQDLSAGEETVTSSALSAVFAFFLPIPIAIACVIGNCLNKTLALALILRGQQGQPGATLTRANAMTSSRLQTLSKTLDECNKHFCRALFPSFNMSLKSTNFINHFGGKLLRKQEVKAYEKPKDAIQIMAHKWEMKTIREVALFEISIIIIKYIKH